MASIFVLLNVESIHFCIRIQAESSLLGMNFLRKGSSSLNITVMGKKLEDL
jgi:hypothetical protein